MTAIDTSPVSRRPVAAGRLLAVLVALFVVVLGVRALPDPLVATALAVAATALVVGAIIALPFAVVALATSGLALDD